MRRVSLLALLLALVFAACGGDDNGGGDGNGGGGGAATSTPAGEDDGGAAGGTEPEGKALFASTCGSCHTLADANTSGTFGPNLDDLGPDEARVLSAIENGPGQMPAGLLAGAEAEAVASYVAGAAGS